MAINRTQTNFRERTDVLGAITPHNHVQKDITSPAGEWRPANWLPVQFTKTDRDQGEDAFVISSGKVVALDTESRVVPAGLKTSMAGASALSYTATDVDWKTEDLVTGLEVTGAVTYTAAQVGASLL